MAEQRRRVAVIGAGVAGLTAAYVLRDSSEVTLYEADDRLGGHAHTHDVVSGDGVQLGVDSGFIVHNRRTYPRLGQLFAELGVRTQETTMSLSVSCGGCGLEYAGARGLVGLFARSTNVASPRFLALVAQVPRFHRHARALLARDRPNEDGGEEPTLGEFLAAGGYTPYFVRHFVVPLVSSVWSCGPNQAMEYPARYLFSFLDNHGMLTVTGSPTWRTVTGGSRSYVELVRERVSVVRTSTPVRSVLRGNADVTVHSVAGSAEVFDAAVIATHADQALRLLAEPTAAERHVLGAFGYSSNPTVLHTDVRVLPRRRRAWASWNYQLPHCAPTSTGVRISYHLNRLQGFHVDDDFIVSLGSADSIDPNRVIATMDYQHPIYTPRALAAQRRLPDLNTPNLAFAGAYHGWGFHEDGCRSGVDAAAALGVNW